jgi:hypothetical protein
MNAKQKLNMANVNGAILLSGLAGWMTDSMAVFVLVLIVLLCSAVSSRQIR